MSRPIFNIHKRRPHFGSLGGRGLFDAVKQCPHCGHGTHHQGRLVHDPERCPARAGISREVREGSEGAR